MKFGGRLLGSGLFPLWIRRLAHLGLSLARKKAICVRSSSGGNMKTAWLAVCVCAVVMTGVAQNSSDDSGSFSLPVVESMTT